jgi:hypothetical protein
MMMMQAAIPVARPSIFSDEKNEFFQRFLHAVLI